MACATFPYNHIRKGERIILYGAGEIGMEYRIQCLLYNYAIIVKWVDINYEKYNDKYPVESADVDYFSVSYDKVLIAVADELTALEIKAFLVSKGVKEKFIVWEKPSLITENSHDFDYQISIVTMAKNEDDYLLEWIAYHKLIGIDHIFLYDNNEYESVPLLLHKYLKEGFVTLIKWPGIARQAEAYNNAIDCYKNRTKYMAFIDADEFIVLNNEQNIGKYVDDIFNKYSVKKESRYNQGIRDFQFLEGKMVGGLGINWRVYGTGGHVKKPKGLVMENYLYRAEDDNEVNAHIKSIVNPRVVEKMYIHSAKYQYGFCCVSEKGSIIEKNFFPDGRCENIRINHYRTKSEEEMLRKIQRGRGTTPISDEQKLERERQFRLEISSQNKLYDPIALRYVDKVKKLLVKGDNGD